MIRQRLFLRCAVCRPGRYPPPWLGDGIVCPYSPRTAELACCRRAVRASLDEETEIKPAIRKFVEVEFERGASIPVVPPPTDSTVIPDAPRLTLVIGNPGAEWGTLPLPGADVTVDVGDTVFIIQHPNGGPKQIAMAGNQVAYVDARLIQYTTDTLPGSSGRRS